ncbi:DNA-J related domain-containing protein [Kaarinaea lacus]
MSLTINENLFNWIYDCLQQNHTGISEHELLKQLAGDVNSGNWSEAFNNNHALFKAHFLLFHILYQLRNRLLKQKLGILDINPVKIRLLPYREGDASLDEYDALMDYYLDITNLENTSAREVDEMLAGFYIKFTNKDKRQQALQILGLKDPVDDHAIKKQYRRLAMEHHPDRGGDHTVLQEINNAVKILIG